MSYEVRFDRTQSRQKPLGDYLAAAKISRVNAIIAHANRSQRDFCRFIRHGLEGSFELKIASKQYGLAWRISRADMRFLLGCDEWLKGVLEHRYRIHPKLIAASVKAVRRELLS